MADAQDLKSWVLKKTCGFESRLRHHPRQGRQLFFIIRTKRHAHPAFFVFFP